MGCAPSSTNDSKTGTAGTVIIAPKQAETAPAPQPNAAQAEQKQQQQGAATAEAPQKNEDAHLSGKRERDPNAAPPVEVLAMEGKTIPSVSFKTRTADGQWAEKTTDALFKGKKIVVFSLPGAFTPTCSSSHLPTYNNLAPVFKAHGIDDILCVSVNDTFVMNAWAQGEHADNITMIPDGTGAFTEGMGMLKDFSAVGFGKRSWRYSAYIEDAVVKKMFIEPVKEGDPFEVSDAHTMLKYLFPEAKPTPSITVFSMTNCPHCARAKELLKSKGLGYEEVVVDGSNKVTFSTIRAVSGRDTTPQIFIDGKHIGGADDLVQFFA